MNASNGFGLLVSVDWLADHLRDPDLVVLDASWYLPAMQRDGRAEFLATHIPGAAFFDIDENSDHTTSLPHMLPTPEAFAAAVGALGVGNGQRVVVYDGAGLFSAPRVWWMLRIFGLRDVAILDGGLPAWTAAGEPTEQGPAHPVARTFTPKLDASRVAGLEEVRAALLAGSHQVLDARSASRFYGREPEPRAGLASGHMPGSLSLPSSDLIAGGRLKAPEELRALFAAREVDGRKPVITSCGSGVSAAIITLALERVGLPTGSLYDGSWTEWGGRPDLPVATS